jgi:hypothetical protein
MVFRGDDRNRDRVLLGFPAVDFQHTFRNEMQDYCPRPVEERCEIGDRGYLNCNSFRILSLMLSFAYLILILYHKLLSTW